MTQLMSSIGALFKDRRSSAVTAACGTFAFVVIWLVSDYRAWVAFGTGGTPPTVTGYLKMTKIRLAHSFSGDDTKDHSRLSSEGESYLPDDFLERRTSRPRIIARTMPQRQEPEALEKGISERLHAIPSKLVAEHSELLYLDKSHTEGRSTDAIYAKPGIPGRSRGAQDRILKNEVAHVHPAENSLHVWLTQPDAKKVVKAGWGERFPLSSLGMVDDGWTFVYAPRSMEDVDVIEQIAMAGVAHLTGERIQNRGRPSL